ncbi:MAG: hypothetical protein NTZ01_01445 [Verrucomicrobia bacterium]|nr:hypothetical protein [Verrucomicrobiota bacterium]
MVDRSWSQGDSETKRKELGAYRMLGLGREMKSIRRRSATDQIGLYRYIGEGTADRPWLKVTRAEYLVTRRAVQVELLGRKAASDMDQLRIERRTYERMAASEATAAGLREAFREAHGRGMTPRELELYGKAAGQAGLEFKPDLKAKAMSVRRRLMAEVVEKVENRVRGGQIRLQEVWAAVAGEETAQESMLEYIHGFKGVAWIRCLSSTRRHEIARRMELKEKLSAKLGVKIRRLAFR